MKRALMLGTLAVACAAVAQTPDPTAAEFGNATWIQGRFQAVVG